MLRQDVSGQAYASSALTTYDYRWNNSTNGNSARLNDQASSAKFWYARNTPGGLDSPLGEYLAHEKNTEFRGHGLVTVREYDGASIDPARLLRTTLSEFYQVLGWNAASGWSQGWNICTPATVTHGPQTDVVESDACYVNMLKSELWKGRPKTVSVFNGNGIHW